MATDAAGSERDRGRTFACRLKRGQHLAIIGENRPRLYFTMTAVQCLGAFRCRCTRTPPPPKWSFVFDNAEIHFAVVEDQEQVDKVLEIREKVPHLQQIFYDDARGLRNYRQPGLQSYEALRASGQQLLTATAHRDRRRNRTRAARPMSAAMFYTSGTTGNAERCRARLRQSDRRRPRRCRDGSAELEGRGARLPADGVDRPEHLFVYAVAGVRLHGELSRVGGHGHRRHARDRSHLLLRAAARARSTADAGDDPDGRRLCDQAAHVSLLHARRAQRRRAAVGQGAGRLRRPAALFAGRFARLRAAAQFARHEPGARCLHRR